MEKDLISIVMPVYNVSKFLDRCMQSILNQTYKNIEVICVNDGSKDNSLEILQRYAKEDNRVIIIDKENAGCSAARNSGLEIAKGSYITFLDSDDYVSPIFIQTLYETIVNNNADMSVCKYIRKQEKSTQSWRKTPLKKVVEFTQVEAMQQLMSGVLFDVCVWNKMFKRELLENIKFDETIYYAEDVKFNYFAMKNITKCVYTPTLLYAYVMRKGSLVKSKFNPKKLSGLRGIAQIVEDTEINYPDVTTVARSWYCMVHLEMLYYIYRDKYGEQETITRLANTMQDNIQFLRKCKLIQTYRRTLVPIALSILKSIFIRRANRKIA